MKRQIKHFDLYDTEQDKYYIKNLTAAEIGAMFNIDKSNIHKYAQSGYLINRKFSLREIECVDKVENVSKSTSDFTLEWDKIRFRLNPKARMQS